MKMMQLNNIINKNTSAQKFSVDLEKVKTDEKEKKQIEGKKEEKIEPKIEEKQEPECLMCSS
jgi:hypothetical protein